MPWIPAIRSHLLPISLYRIRDHLVTEIQVKSAAETLVEDIVVVLGYEVETAVLQDEIYKQDYFPFNRA